MNLAETTFWVEQLFPGTPELSTRTVRMVSSGRHGQDHDSAPFDLAVFSLYDDTSNRRTEKAAATLNLGAVNCGLVGDDGVDIRVEVFAVGYEDFDIEDFVLRTAATIAEDPEALSPIPGRVIPGVVQQTSASTKHALCVVPYVWPEGVPNVAEKPEEVSLHERDSESATGRMTTMTQLVSITDDEFEFYVNNGPGPLMEKLAAADADLRDFTRSSVV